MPFQNQLSFIANNVVTWTKQFAVLFLRSIFFKITLLCCLFGFGMMTVHAQKIVVLELDGTLLPASADYIHRGLQQATNENAAGVILKMNSPGGLMKPAEKIIADILRSPVPVTTFVSPSEGRVASVAVLVALSGNVVAITPGANIGSTEHPIGLEDTSASAVQDFQNEILAIAELRKINPEVLWHLLRGETAFTAGEALKNHVADLSAGDISELLGKWPKAQEYTMENSALTTQLVDMNYKEQFLNLISQPNVMYLLLLIGVMGILFEAFNPGGIVSGLVGLVCLILSGYGMSQLPLSYVGLAVLVLGILLLLLEVKFTSYGLLTLGGTAALFVGALFLIQPDESFHVVDISLPVLIIATLVMVLFFVFVVGIGLKAQFKKPLMGRYSMVGKKGVALTSLVPEGKVRINGEIWDAEAEGGNIEAGVGIEVIRINEFILIVKSLASHS